MFICRTELNTQSCTNIMKTDKIFEHWKKFARFYISVKQDTKLIMHSGKNLKLMIKKMKYRININEHKIGISVLIKESSSQASTFKEQRNKGILTTLQKWSYWFLIRNHLTLWAGIHIR